MAKKKASTSGGVNKSQAIREALKKSPTSSPKELSAELTAAGITVSPAYISIIKSSLKAKKKERNKVAPTSHNGDTVLASELVEAKRLVDRVGGIEKAESLLGTLKRIL